MPAAAATALRPVREDDVDALATLFRACFGMQVTSSYFHWKYWENPCGPVTGFVADAGDRLGGFYGVIPEPWSVGGVDVLVHQSMDTMTHPDFRRRGLFVAMAERTYDAIGERLGDTVLVGIPGPESLPGFTSRLGWTVVHNFELIGLPAARMALTRTPKGLTTETVRGHDERVEAVLAATPHVAPAWPRLTGTFFDWRVHGMSPKRFAVALALERDEPVGVCVYCRSGPRSTLIAHLAGVEGHPLARWARPALRHAAAQAGGAVLYAWRPRGAELASVYSSLGFRANRLGRGPLRETRPLIARSDSGSVAGIDWTAADSFDVQALMQD
ncbi:MAG TPA: GNAT family N-acetyltransferase [Solirubrobacteraceae bacterium]|jgi:hypothetical protein|nr:GNAT family N-acetyltransferase [Solirubrobacteraceae bacterium]